MNEVCWIHLNLGLLIKPRMVFTFVGDKRTWVPLGHTRKAAANQKKAPAEGYAWLV